MQSATQGASVAVLCLCVPFPCALIPASTGDQDSQAAQCCVSVCFSPGPLVFRLSGEKVALCSGILVLLWAPSATPQLNNSNVLPRYYRMFRLPGNILSSQPEGALSCTVQHCDARSFRRSFPCATCSCIYWALGCSGYQVRS